MRSKIAAEEQAEKQAEKDKYDAARQALAEANVAAQGGSGTEQVTQEVEDADELQDPPAKAVPSSSPEGSAPPNIGDLAMGDLITKEQLRDRGQP